MAQKHHDKAGRRTNGADQDGKTKVAGKEQAGSSAKPRTEKPGHKVTDFTVAGVGASAGGLEAFTQFLQALPDKPGIAFVFIPHLDPGHKSAMAEVLSRSTRMQVIEAQQGMRVKADCVYVIPPNTEMTIAGKILFLTPRQHGPGYLPVDRFLRSLAADVHRNAVGIVLSGTATDGTLGLAAIKSEGGITFAQDPATAKHDGMPNSAINSGCVDLVLPPKGIAEELTRVLDHFSRQKDGEDGHRTHLMHIFQMLKKTNRVDFTDYKPGTIRRRIQRRMALQHVTSIGDYFSLLQHNPNELDQLYQDLLINVTSFFRDPQVFEALAETVYPGVLKDRAPSDPIRIWVPGCSTGEEAYSHAMAILEYIRNNRAEATFQIFGTDISEKAVRQARTGIFKESIAADVSPERLRRFFNKVESGYQVNKQIRDLCIFAVQNVFSDPPFSHMDMLSCRNVLIYLGRNLQQRVVPIFHYALKQKGYLIVGNAEGIIGTDAESLFEVADQKNRIYRKRLVPSPMVFRASPQYHEIPAPLGDGDQSAEVRREETRGPRPTDLNREADRYLLSRYAPASVLVSDNLEILQTRGPASRYLEVPSGRATLNVLKMARPGLLFDLQKGLEEARTSKTPIRRENVRVETGDGTVSSNLEIRPLQSPLHPHQGFLLLFEDHNFQAGHKREERVLQPGAPVSEKGRETQNFQLKQELAATKEYLQAIIESLEASNEELQSANEEIQSGNEELQSTNEELQTSKEELESANEELNTVNEEMRDRNRQLTDLNNDLLNVLSSVKIAIVLLGADLTIRRFTPEAEKLLGLSSTDVGRPISKVRTAVPLEAMESTMIEAMQEVRTYDNEVRSVNHTAYQVRINPYRTMDNRIDGVVIAFTAKPGGGQPPAGAPKKPKKNATRKTM